MKTTHFLALGAVGVFLAGALYFSGSGGENSVSEVSSLNKSETPSITTMQKNKYGYFDADPDTFATLAENPDVTMVNVHTPFYGEIPGTDASVPYNKTEALLATLPEDKNAPVALYCQGGGMSAAAARDIIAAGYTNVYDLTGGMVAYERSGRVLLSSPLQ